MIPAVVLLLTLSVDAWVDRLGGYKVPNDADFKGNFFYGAETFSASDSSGSSSAQAAYTAHVDICEKSQGNNLNGIEHSVSGMQTYACGMTRGDTEALVAYQAVCSWIQNGTDTDLAGIQAFACGQANVVNSA